MGGTADDLTLVQIADSYQMIPSVVLAGLFMLGDCQHRSQNATLSIFVL